MQLLDALRSFRKNILPGEIRPAKQAKPSLFSFLSCAIFSSKKTYSGSSLGQSWLGRLRNVHPMARHQLFLSVQMFWRYFPSLGPFVPQPNDWTVVIVWGNAFASSPQQHSGPGLRCAIDRFPVCHCVPWLVGSRCADSTLDHLVGRALSAPSLVFHTPHDQHSKV